MARQGPQRKRENSGDNRRSLRGSGAKARGVWLAVHFPWHGAYLRKYKVFRTESSRPALPWPHSHFHCVPLLPVLLLHHPLRSPVLPGPLPREHQSPPANTWPPSSAQLLDSSGTGVPVVTQLHTNRLLAHTCQRCWRKQVLPGWAALRRAPSCSCLMRNGAAPFRAAVTQVRNDCPVGSSPCLRPAQTHSLVVAECACASPRGIIHEVRDTISAKSCFVSL